MQLSKSTHKLKVIYHKFTKFTTMMPPPNPTQKKKKQLIKILELAINGSYACPLVGTQSNSSVSPHN